MSNSSISVLARLCIIAFVLNAIWEFGQCLFLYNMWGWPFLKATVWMWAATIGDVFIVLALYGINRQFFSDVGLTEFTVKHYAFFVTISFLASVVLEWGAKFLELWDYSELMPALSIFNYEIGLSPILQITFLPALSVYFTKVLTEK